MGLDAKANTSSTGFALQTIDPTAADLTDESGVVTRDKVKVDGTAGRCLILAFNFGFLS